MKINTTKNGHTRNAYKTAINDALDGSGRQLHNPAVKYSAENGFYVESALIGDYAALIWSANFNAKTGKPYCVPSYDSLTD